MNGQKTPLADENIKPASQLEIKFLSQTLGHLGDAVFLINSHLRFCYVNDAASHALGYSREELLDMTPFDIDPDVTMEACREMMKAEMGELIQFESRHRNSNGDIFPVEISAIPFERDGEEFALSLVRNISVRKHIDNLLSFIAGRGHVEDSDGFPNALARFLGQELGVRHVFINLLADDESDLAEIIAHYSTDGSQPKKRFRLQYTPCFEAVSKHACSFPQGLQNHFPMDDRLPLMEAESFVGCSINGSSERPLGVIAIVDDKPIRNNNSVVQILQLAAPHIAAEIEGERYKAALRAREWDFRSLAESSPDNIIRYDRDGYIRYLNNRLERFLGFSTEELNGKLTRDIWPDDRFDKIDQAMWQAIREGEASTVIQHLDINTPEPRYHQIRMVPERNAAGEIIGALAFGEDVTALFQLQMDISARNQEFRRFVETSTEGVWSLGADHRTTYANARMLELLGLTEEEIIGRPLTDFMFEEDFADHEQHMAARRQGISEQYERRFRHKDGSELWCQVSAKVLRDDEGKFQGSFAMLTDITERKQAEYRVDLLNFALNSVNEGAFLTDAKGQFCFVNEEACRSLGYSRQELFTMGVADIDPDWSEERWLEMWQRSNKPTSLTFETTHRTKEGRVFPVEIKANFIQYAGKEYGLALVRDISERKQAEEKLLQSEQRLRLHTELSPLGFLEWDENFCATEWNTACEKMFGYSREEALGRHATDLILPAEGRERVNGIYRDLMNQTGGTHSINENITKDGRKITVEWFNTTLVNHDGKSIGVASVCWDITELNERRQQVYQLAYFDALTELPNRALLRERLQQALNHTSPQGAQTGLILIDLGRFSEVNDALGRQAGDRLLCLAADRLQRCIRDSDTAARLGDDEFAILLPELPHGEETAQEIATSIKAALDTPFVLNEVEVFVSCNIGIAIYPQNGADSDTLLKHADSAMHFAKQAGHNKIRFYSKEITDNINQHLRLESELRHALEREELELYYQPKVLLDDGRLLGSEALIRWNHPERGLVTPDHFIPVAEESGLILEIGNRVLWDACHTATQWNGQDKPLHKVAVNLSPHQFLVGNLLETIESALVGTGCDPAWLELEITESLLLDKDDNIHQLLLSLRDMGLSIAIDDFGTGYSSLSYLADFPINVLKIDRSFIMQATEGGYHAELIKAVCVIAQSLDQTVVAEGVETEAQAAILRTYGCHIAQGYLYGKPMCKTAFEQYAEWTF